MSVIPIYGTYSLKRRSRMLLLVTIVMAIPSLLLFGVVRVPYPNSLVEASPAITIHSPFNDQVVVGLGGDSYQDNQHHSMWATVVVNIVGRFT